MAVSFQFPKQLFYPSFTFSVPPTSAADSVSLAEPSLYSHHPDSQHVYRCPGETDWDALLFCETDWNIPSVSKTGFFAGLWTSHPLCLLKDMFSPTPPFKKNWKEFQTLLINCKHKNCTESIHVPFNQILLSLTFDPICFILCTLLHAHNFFPEPFEAKLHASWLLLLSTSVWIF